MGVNSIVFYKRFPDEESCYNYPAEIKWEEGYVCKKCGHTNYCSGRKPYSRRCIRCKYDESPTAGTMIDKCKFSLHLAFHIVFKLSTKKKVMSSPELSHEFDLRQMTCWEFKRKVQQAMRSSMRYPLTGYLPLKKRYPFLEQKPSRKERNFPELHIYIMNIQGWLRGIHHHCSKEYLQGYLDEYHYRYNRRSQIGTIFDNLAVRMMRYKSIQGL